MNTNNKYLSGYAMKTSFNVSCHDWRNANIGTGQFTHPLLYSYIALIWTDHGDYFSNLSMVLYSGCKIFYDSNVFQVPVSAIVVVSFQNTSILTTRETNLGMQIFFSMKCDVFKDKLYQK